MLNPERPGHTVRLGRQLSEENQESLIQVLKENSDLFAWKPEDVKGIDPEIAVHRLNIKPRIKPVIQKRRHFSEQQNEIIKKEMEKLLEIGHIERIQFPRWIANVVLVPKPGNKWRMCIGFRDLNKSCPKDHYPLPRIDQLVDSTAGCALLSMMDASQGYHQILLHSVDRPDVSFINSSSTYCYAVMPFGLKNAGATNQRMVDRMFRSQLGRKMEAYVDDMLVKSKKIETHASDLKETLRTVCKYRMRLNLAKCTFKVRSGKFLEYMVTESGIEVNPLKVKVIHEMKPPHTLKEAQTLTERIIALSRFVSRLAERSLPFFKLLCKGGAFEWGKECQQAFEQLKEFLASLSLLKQPELGCPLFVYLSIREASISAVKVREDGKSQCPVYFVSKVLHGAELRYSEVEKVTLALVNAAMRLPRTDHPLSSILGKIDTLGRLVKWAVELRQFNIHYEPRTAIKAQALADFIQETTRMAEEREWKLYMDGSATRYGAGARIVLISQEEDELEFAIKLQYKTSKNEAEYEALLQGLSLAEKAGAKRVKAYTYS